MQSKKLLLALGATALMGFGAAAQAYTAVVVSTAPPPVRHEVVPAARPGHVWAPGHYEWRHHRYSWVRGHWLRAREGYSYTAPHWVQRRNGDWVMVAGGWQSERGPRGDLDHDGIANRFDHDKDGDGIRNRNDPHPKRADHVARRGPNGDMDRDGIANRYDRDKDGDGVRNRRDDHPLNPNRS